MAMVIQNALFPLRATDKDGAPVLSQSTTVSSAAVAATGYTSTPAVDGVGVVVLDIQDNDVRCRWDGVNPSGTVGHILPASTAYTWSCSQYNAAKFIRISTATADAVIFASPFMIS